MPAGEAAQPVPDALIDLVARGLAAVGAATVPVSGSSMQPTLTAGDRVVLHAVDPGAIKEQDVIAFRASGHLVLHRVHARLPGHLVTAGDHQNLFDPPVPLRDVVGIARSVAARPSALRWPAAAGQSGPLAATADGGIDVWVVEGPHGPDALVPPPGWTLHRRPRVGVCVSAGVRDELTAATWSRPCVAVTEHAVHAAEDALAPGSLPPGTQVLIGCSFGRVDDPVPGHLIPAGVADVVVRVGAPLEALSPAETLRRLAGLVATAVSGP